jgi:hypothetical protein
MMMAEHIFASEGPRTSASGSTWPLILLMEPGDDKGRKLTSCEYQEAGIEDIEGVEDEESHFIIATQHHVVNISPN